MNYFKHLSREQETQLANNLQTTANYFRHYKTGHKAPGVKRIGKIIQWAEENTPDNVPTFQELIAIKSSKEVV